jgi:hypothetical protein
MHNKWFAFIADKKNPNSKLVGTGKTQMQAVLNLLGKLGGCA